TPSRHRSRLACARLSVASSMPLTLPPPFAPCQRNFVGNARSLAEASRGVTMQPLPYQPLADSNSVWHLLCKRGWGHHGTVSLFGVKSMAEVVACPGCQGGPTMSRHRSNLNNWWEQERARLRRLGVTLERAYGAQRPLSERQLCVLAEAGR